MHRVRARESTRLTTLTALAVIGWALSGCSESPTSPAPPKPQLAVSDGAHGGGVTGLYFLPPMIAQPSFTGSFDGDIAALNPRVALCDVTSGPDPDCGGATAAVIVFTPTSTPAITVDLTTPQYQVNWDTRGTGFVAGHTYRLHVTAGTAGARRELGFADILLTTTPGQVKDLAGNDLVVLADGRTLPVHFRIETGIAGSLVVSAATASITGGSSDLLTATVEDLHGNVLAGAIVAWSVATTPASGVADANQPLTPTSGATGTTGTTTTTFKAGVTGGSATVKGTSAGLLATATISVTTGYLAYIASGYPTTYNGVLSGWGGNTVLALSTASNTVLGTLSVGDTPRGVAFTPNGAFAYVTNWHSSTVSVIATANDAVVATIPVGTGPLGVAITPDGQFAYVTNSESAPATVSVISTANNSVVATVGGLGYYARPLAVAITPDGALAYVVLGNLYYIAVVSTASNTVVANIHTATPGPDVCPTACASYDFPSSVTITPDGRFAYVAVLPCCGDPSKVEVISIANSAVVGVVIDDNLAGGSAPVGMAITPDGAFVYVAKYSDNTVSVIATASNAVVATVPVGTGPIGVAITPDGRFAYVTNSFSNSVSVIATANNSVVATLGLPSGPGPLAIGPIPQ